jgi:RND family efflux transporter MFP subunit
VKSGEIVARIESRDVGATREQAVANVRLAEANLEQGMAELTNAEVELKRQQDLAKQNFVSQSAVDAAQARALKARATISSLKASIGVAQANYKVAEVNFEQTLIRAPFDGVILTKNANVGDIITPFSAAAGTTGAVVNIADMSTLEVEADVSEASIGKISVGQAAEIQLDAFTELRLAGKVSRVVPTVDRSKATLLVKVTFVDHDARVLPDMSAKVAFLQRPLTPEERKPLVAVRPAAIVKRGDRDVVFVVQKGEAPKADAPVADAVETVMSRPVTSGAKIGDLVQVTGVAAGDKVVLSPGDKIADGVAVTQLKK